MKQLVYLIGGGPGSGKSSVAKALKRQFGFSLIKGDDLEGVHRQEAADRDYPVNSYLDSLSPSERRLELIRLSAKQELARQEELFYILLKELRSRKFTKLIIEGNFLLPNLVKNRFEFPYKAVWLLPTLKFQSKIYMERSWAIDLVTQTEDPTMTLHNWVKRDHKYVELIRKKAQAAGFDYLMIDGENDIDYTTKWVKNCFRLK